MPRTTLPSPPNLARDGWGVIFAQGGDPAVAEALRPLLEHRRQQAGADRYRELRGGDGYRAGETKLDFLARHGVAPGPPQPDRMPANLLLVGNAEAIAFDFQFQLALQHRVGRLDFDDPESYHRYGQRVIAAETEGSTSCPHGLLVAPRNPEDGVTERIVDLLVNPLAQSLLDDTFELLIAETATKERLLRALENRPELLFLAGHGLRLSADDPRQRQRQGALLCQDWPGPRRARGEVPDEQIFAAEDVPEDAPRMVFHFGCYSAGTPCRDGFDHLAGGDSPPLASRPFVAALPRRFLELGSLAVVGHVERTWGWSFLWPGAGSQRGVFELLLDELLAGATIGQAMAAFARRHGELASELLLLLEERERGLPVDQDRLVGLWTATADARRFIILGDPAARLFSPRV
ncbi:MAG: hypothetical protein AAF604_11520 [Acidobacteriota bacterium]